MIQTRKVTCFRDPNSMATFWRAHVWNASGYSTKTFLNHAEAVSWTPKPRLKGTTR